MGRSCYHIAVQLKGENLGSRVKLFRFMNGREENFGTRSCSKTRARKSASTKNAKTAAARRRRRRNMLLLFETPAGYSLFKVKDENKLKDIDVRSASFLSLFLESAAN